ncbi:MAG: surface lipoprotein assembly modifier [Paracoccaceae bacterium]|nr:surface lipoprotein assembly modifier [Paracoccaceae bacterium]
MSRFALARRLKGLARGLSLALGCFLAAPAATLAEPRTLTLEETQVLAFRSAMAGDVQLAAPLAAILLENDPQDEYGLLTMSALYLGAGDDRQSFRNARLAFRHADDPELKFHAARMSAISAMAGNRTIPTQFWLRRAGDLAPSEAHRARVEQNYQVFQAQNPWRWRFDTSVEPSSNVNGGSESPYNIIDGVPLVGVLSSDAQALSGWIGQSRLSLAYRLRREDRSQTDVTGSAYIKRVRLSDEARAAAPGFSESDLSAEEFTVGLRHFIALQKPGRVLQFGGKITHYRQALDPSFNALTASATYVTPLTERLRFSGHLELEARDYHSGDYGDAGRASVGLSYELGNGDRLSGSLYVSDTMSPIFFLHNQAAYAKVTYQFGKPIMDVRVAASIGASYTDYPNYALGFIVVPGGRQDEGLFADLDLTFEAIEYAGFSPSLRIRHQRTESNVSRFTTSEWAVSVGLQSNF